MIVCKHLKHLVVLNEIKGVSKTLWSVWATENSSTIVFSGQIKQFSGPNFFDLIFWGLVIGRINLEPGNTESQVTARQFTARSHRTSIHKSDYNANSPLFCTLHYFALCTILHFALFCTLHYRYHIWIFACRGVAKNGGTRGGILWWHPILVQK